jgi:hypothetical protein
MKGVSLQWIATADFWHITPKFASRLPRRLSPLPQATATQDERPAASRD